MSISSNILNTFPEVNAADKILVGCSGGADSVVLAHLLHKEGYKIGLAHCHFNLRGEDADLDQAFVRALAQQLDVPFITTKFETATYAQTRGISIQMAARNLRYFWFEKIRKEDNYQWIAIGSHLTDNIETFLFNATKGTGIKGLRGIKKVNGPIIRPFLRFSKKEILDYANTEKLEWREDLSNASLKYARNKIRHEVLPVLESLNPNLEATFNRNFERLSELEKFANSQMDAIWEEWVTSSDKGLILTIQSIQNNPHSKAILRYKLEEFGFNGTHVTDLLEAINGQPGSKIESKDFVIYVDRSVVHIHPKRFFAPPEEYLITEFIGELSDPVPLKLTHYHEPVKIIPDRKMAYFDFDKLVFPLRIRKWKAGDSFRPFGMTGKKKISDYLIDEKVPNHEKENIWIIEDQKEICWIVGMRPSETFRVSAKTKQMYTIEWLT